MNETLIKYKTGGYGSKLIEPVTIISETEKMIKYNNGDRIMRTNKRSSYENYFDTESEAFDYLKKRIQMRIQGHENSLKNERDRLGDLNTQFPHLVK